MGMAQHVPGARFPCKKNEGGIPVVELIKTRLREDHLSIIRLVTIDIAARANERRSLLGHPIS